MPCLYYHLRMRICLAGPRPLILRTETTSTVRLVPLRESQSSSSMVGTDLDLGPLRDPGLTGW